MLDLTVYTEGKLDFISRLYLLGYRCFLLINSSNKEIRYEKRRYKRVLKVYEKQFKKVDKLVASLPNVKLNLGCGDVLMKDWLNVDMRHDVPGIDICVDLRYPLPFRDGSVDFIYNEHFLEHLSPQDGVRFLKDCFRVLKPGRGEERRGEERRGEERSVAHCYAAYQDCCGLLLQRRS